MPPLQAPGRHPPWRRWSAGLRWCPGRLGAAVRDWVGGPSQPAPGARRLRRVPSRPTRPGATPPGTGAAVIRGPNRRVHLGETTARAGAGYSPTSSMTSIPSSAPRRRTCLRRAVWPLLVVAETAGGQHPPGRHLAAGMVSACPYSGAYPTGYGRYLKNTEGVPEEMFDLLQAPFHPLPAVRDGGDPEVLQLRPGHPDGAAAGHLGQAWPLHDEEAEAGYYARDPGHRGALRDHRRTRSLSTATPSRSTAAPGWWSTCPAAGWRSNTAGRCR